MWQPGRNALAIAADTLMRFGLIRPGDRVAVGVSGGKDSLFLTALLHSLRNDGRFSFDLELVHLDQKQPGFNRAQFEKNCALWPDLKLNIVEEDTWSIVRENTSENQIPCAICSRLRRGILNRWCAENGFTRLALGHHFDDAAETFFLNLFFGGRLEALKPLTPAENGVCAIRPMILMSEHMIAEAVRQQGITPVACPVCDNYPKSQRREMKEVIAQLAVKYPGLRDRLKTALYRESAADLAPEGSADEAELVSEREPA